MHLGGAMRRKSPKETAFFRREAQYEIHSISKWNDTKNKGDLYKNWSRSLADSLAKVSGKIHIIFYLIFILLFII